MKRLLLILALLAGCRAPSARLTFPEKPLRIDGQTRWYDVNRNGRADFAVSPGALAYDDDEDGVIDRAYDLHADDDDDVPHLVLMLDSVPFRAVAERYRAGGLPWFGPPVKVIPPFPTLTELCFTELLHAPPLPGMVDRYYDPNSGQARNMQWQRLWGYRQPWERRLDYGARFWEGGVSYLHPRPWFAAELERVRRAVDEDSDRLTLAYIYSSSGMLSRFGQRGCDEVLDGATRLCLQLLYERHGAIRITMLADHGHNFARTKNVDLAPLLERAGFHVKDRITGTYDVVLELNGLVTYLGIDTLRPRQACDALLAAPQVDQVMYLEGDHVLVRTRTGSAAVERRRDSVRYRPISGDPLGYAPVLDAMRRRGAIDQGGYASDAAWLAATADHAYPDAPRRIWDAFHRGAVHVPRIMLTMADGTCAGLPSLEKFITMASTHGSLNQDNSATFVITTSRRLDGAAPPLRSADVLPRVAPEAISTQRGGDR